MHQASGTTPELRQRLNSARSTRRAEECIKVRMRYESWSAPGAESRLHFFRARRSSEYVIVRLRLSVEDREEAVGGPLV